MTPKITDEEFLRLWEEHKSPVKVARITGISERRVHSRRRDLENKLKLSLPVGKPIHIQKARHEAGLTDGIAIIFSTPTSGLGSDQLLSRACYGR